LFFAIAPGLATFNVVIHSIPQSISAFTNHLKFEKRYSPHTLRSYQDDLQSFHQFIIENYGECSLEDLQAPFIRSWLATLKEDGLGAGSINRKISALRSFFRFAMIAGVLQKSPMVNISSPKIAKKLPAFVDEGDMQALFSKVDFPDTWQGKTDRLVLGLLYQLGLRLSELAGCKETSIDFSNSAIKVLGKGNKERIIPVGRALLDEIRAYQQAKRAAFEKYDPDVLLLTPAGKKLYPRYIYRVTTGYLPLVTTISRKSPHVLRHTFATHLSNNGAELNAVKDLLGHVSLSSTQIYTHNTIGKLKKVHKTAHPKG
jgi:integrase/recombinase XerC